MWLIACAVVLQHTVYMVDNEAFSGLERILAIGHDLVDVNAFESQIHETGTQVRQLFSPRELRQVDSLSARKGDGQAIHLAAKWAGKESVLKAWSTALGSRPFPYSIDNFPWVQIEIIDDLHGRPSVYFNQSTHMQLLQSLQQQGSLSWLISLSHDGAIASAVVLLGCTAT